MNKSNEIINIEDKLFIDFIDNDNRQSFEQLFKLIRPWMFKMIYRILNDRSAAEDVEQNTWIKVIEKRSKYNNSKGRIVNYIFTIAKNEELKYKYNEQAIKDRNKDCSRRIHSDSDHSLNILSDIETNEKSDLILKAIGSIKKNHQDAILLYYFSELDVKEIAEFLNVPIGTVKSWLDRGRTRLGKIFNDNRVYHDFLNISRIPEV